MEFQLSDVLTDQQIMDLVTIIDSTPDAMDRIHKFKRYLKPHREALEAKGVNYEYLAYALEFGQSFAWSKPELN